LLRPRHPVSWSPREFLEDNFPAERLADGLAHFRLLFVCQDGAGLLVDLGAQFCQLFNAAVTARRQVIIVGLLPGSGVAGSNGP
jgi:hypothetical protein